MCPGVWLGGGMLSSGGALKAMLYLAGIDMGPPRAPTQALIATQLAQLRDDLKRLGFL